MLSGRPHRAAGLIAAGLLAVTLLAGCRPATPAAPAPPDRGLHVLRGPTHASVAAAYFPGWDLHMELPPSATSEQGTVVSRGAMFTSPSVAADSGRILVTVEGWGAIVQLDARGGVANAAAYADAIARNGDAEVEQLKALDDGFELIYSVPFGDGRRRTYIRQMAVDDGAIQCLGRLDIAPEDFDARAACRSMCVGATCTSE